MSVSGFFWGLPNHLANMNGCFTLTKCGPTCAAKMTLRSVEEDLLISGTILKPVFFFSAQPSAPYDFSVPTIFCNGRIGCGFSNVANEGLVRNPRAPPKKGFKILVGHWNPGTSHTPRAYKCQKRITFGDVGTYHP